ncbi:hypothetical protein IIA95_00050 [Patescibacteria group bacterium]|nr:hypothetical protein [Patescibacteria group bacterium]
MLKIFSILIIVILAGFLQPHAMHAQFLSNQDVGSVFIELVQQFSGPVKEFQGPNENYVAWIRSSSIDVNRATITWIHNGDTVASGLGVKTYQFRTGDVGERESLRAIVVANGGRRLEASQVFRINNVDLLWTANTTVPAWYKGKALASPRSIITVSAFPEIMRNGSKTPSSQLIYRWSLDDDFIPEESGAGRRNFSFRADLIPGTEHEITITVSDLSGTRGAQKTIVIPVAGPKVLFYEERPLEGTVIGAALTNFILPAGTQSTFRAVPFFFTRGAPLSYKWFIDGEAAQEEGLPDILRLTAAIGSGGLVSISTTINNVRNILQRISDSFTIDVQ